MDWKWLALPVAVVTFVLLALNLQTVQPLDEAISQVMYGWRAPWLTAVMKLLSNLAHPLVLVALSLALAVIIRQRKQWVPIFANLSISVMLNLGLKEVFARPRPQVLTRLVVERGFSFPSGHSMAAIAFYGFVIYVVRRSTMHKSRKTVWSMLLASVILLIGFSRVYLGVHYPTDVLAGYLVGGSYLIVFIAFVDGYFYQDRSVSESLLALGAEGSLVQSFAHAFDGILSGLKVERNMVIHFAAMALVIVFAFLLGCTPMEWMVLIVLFALVIGAELVNTAVEATINLVTQKQHPLARMAKDTAAGAVLVTAIAAFVIAIIIFAPKVWVLVQAAMRQ